MKKTFIVALLLTTLIINGCAKSGTRESLPQTLGRLKLSKSVTGGKALKQLDFLHKGLEFKPVEILTGYYGGPPQAVLWLSFAKDKKEASKLIGKMPKEAVAPFGYSGYKVEKKATITVKHVRGMGQEHYYFTSGRAVVWLAVNKEYSKDVLNDLISYAERSNW